MTILKEYRVIVPDTSENQRVLWKGGKFILGDFQRFINDGYFEGVTVTEVPKEEGNG